DYVITRRRLLVELKTTRVGSPLGFGRECAKYLYHAQLAFYLAGLAAHGKEMSAAIVAVESDPPHVVQVYTVPDDAIECGREEYRALLRRHVQCRAAGEWGGYAEGPTDLVLPRWAYGDDEDAGDLGLDFGTEEAAA
ncbi:MAG: PD-(D/E)XK nuclease-like domain-containing protein, partial [Gemmatimonadales bacterium]|nr:PD-(D/E)XK nuclease-like domain-containing protein [Gemmatimonadales bacterium]